MNYKYFKFLFMKYLKNKKLKVLRPLFKKFGGSEDS